MSEDKEEEAFNNYLDQRLSEEDLAYIAEQKSNKNPVIKDMKLAKSMLEVMQNERDAQLKSELKGMLAAVQKEEQTPSKNRFPIFYKMAASVLVIVSLTLVLLYLLPDAQDNQELYTAYYQPFTISTETRSETPSGNEAFADYVNADYQSAAVALEKALVTDPANESVQMALANAYMNLDKHEAAMALLNPMKSSQNDVFKQYAYWYLGLVYLKTNQIGLAQQNLQYVVSEKMINAGKARVILESIARG